MLSISNQAVKMVLIVCFFSCLIACSSCRQTNGTKQPNTVVKVGVVTWAGVGPGYVGVAKGFFGNIQVEMRIIEDTNARYSAYSSSDLTMMLTTADQHSREFERGLPGKLFWITDVSNGADGMVALKSIKTLADLKGKRIAYPVGTASDYLLQKALQSVGINRTDVTLRTVDDPNNAIAAFNAGQVDAAVAWEPLLGETVASGKGHILFTSADIPGAIVTAFVAKDEFINDSVTAKAFLDGWQKAIEYSKSNPDEAYAIMAQGMSIKPEEVTGMMSGIKIGDRQLNKDFFCPDSSGIIRLAKVVEDSAAYWKEIGVLNQPPFAQDRLATFTQNYLCR
ncbi:MAG TPA: ABC transporter substrate-binding protein [Blastocatellia bacterium]|nr:ABC transporter substrate-binding protein [Blastocatellia bacterium]